MFEYGYGTTSYIKASDLRIGSTISYYSGSRAYGEYRMAQVVGIELTDNGLYRFNAIDTSDDSDVTVTAWEREDMEVWD
jgi:DNA polymerase/3'-5' exonuclease PolX